MEAFLQIVLLTLFHFSTTSGAFVRNYTTSISKFEVTESYRLLASSVKTATTKEDSPLECALSCLGFSWCFSYNFQKAADSDGKHTCEALAADRFNHSLDLQPSLDFDHYSIGNPCSENPCMNDAKCVALYDLNDFHCECPPRLEGKSCEFGIEYFMADPAQNCDNQCAVQGFQCVAQGGFPGGTSGHIFAELGFPCATSAAYAYPDNPARSISTHRCFGATGIPENILCDRGHNSGYRRLCPCKHFGSGKNCLSLFESGHTQNGLYLVNPDDKGSFLVYCDMTTDGGGWTVFQRRQDGSQDFYLGWSEYKAGFGKLTGEFWLGNDKIHRLTAVGSMELRVEIEDWSGGTAYAKYGSFGVGDEQSLYELSVGSYSGTAGDSLTYHNNMKFSTKDRDNDVNDDGNCADGSKGGWWYNKCQYANLNGQYLGNAQGFHGVRWYHRNNNDLSMKSAAMKLRPKT